jgi:AcrR family transcriptional regulator
MSTTDTRPTADLLARRPTRADALRNYEKLIATARIAFAEGGREMSLEEIARRAGVGIGTLYRNFPTRQALLETVYLEELEALCRSAEDLAGLAPWDALVGWLHRFVGYLATKQALAGQLLDHIDRESEFFGRCRAGLYTAGEPLLARAQEAGVVRADTDFDEVMQMVSGIGKISTAEPDQIQRILDIALDGLRYSDRP